MKILTFEPQVVYGIPMKPFIYKREQTERYIFRLIHQVIERSVKIICSYTVVTTSTVINGRVPPTNNVCEEKLLRGYIF